MHDKIDSIGEKSLFHGRLNFDRYAIKTAFDIGFEKQSQIEACLTFTNDPTRIKIMVFDRRKSIRKVSNHGF